MITKKTKTVTRSAKTGEFVPAKKAKTSPKTTTTERVPKKSTSAPRKSIGRDAGTGEFVSKSTVKKKPSTTITQTVKKGSKKTAARASGRGSGGSVRGGGSGGKKR